MMCKLIADALKKAQGKIFTSLLKIKASYSKAPRCVTSLSNDNASNELISRLKCQL